MQSYLVNLDRSPKRLAFMDAQLRAHGIAYQRVPGVDGKALSQAGIDAVLEKRPGGPNQSSGEVGCFMSHRRCWQTIVDSGEAYACVLEDDIEISPRLGRLLRTPEWIPRDADLIKVETFLETVWFDRRLISIGNGIKLGRLRSPHHGCAGYIVSRDAARRLLALSERFSDTIDVFMFHPGAGFSQHFAMYQTIPGLCVQERFLSKSTDEYLPSTLLDVRARPRFRPLFTYPRRTRIRKELEIRFRHWLRNRIGMIVPFDGAAAKSDMPSTIPAWVPRG